MTQTVSVENAAHYPWGAGCDGWHLVQNETLSVIQERIPPGRGEVRHYHERARQFFFVLEGEAMLRIGAETVVLRPHQGVEVAPTVRHEIHNASMRDVIFLVISSPASHGDRHNE